MKFVLIKKYGLQIMLCISLHDAIMKLTRILILVVFLLFKLSSGDESDLQLGEAIFTLKDNSR